MSNTKKPEISTCDSWAVVELFGHQRIAGRVTDVTLGGCSFLRVDVPATTKPAYTKYFGNGAIYAMTPCTEEVARLAAQQIERYHEPIPVELPKPPLALAPVPDSDYSEEDDDAGYDEADDE